MKRKNIFLLSFFLFVLISCQENQEIVTENETDSETTIEPEVEDEKEKNTVSLYAVGDNLIHEEIIDYARLDNGSFDFKPIYKNVVTDIKESDLSFINQESIIGGDDLELTGYPAFNTPSDMAEDLVNLGFDIIGGSNNHSLDRGTEGIKNTLTYWEEFEDDVLFTGVFDSQEDRDTVPVIEKNGITFSVLTYTYGTNGIEPEESYQLNYFDSDLITEDVEEAQEISDFVLVAAHWGDEHSFEPNEMQEEYAQLFADLEVDAVIGSHSHTLQPIEWITGENGNETLVIYSLGNFIAATTSDINLLSGNVQMDFVEDDEEYSIENVQFEPHVIHYEEEIEGDIDSRTDFEIFKLDEYPDDLAKKHALNNFEDNLIDQDDYEDKVNETIDSEFLK